LRRDKKGKEMAFLATLEHDVFISYAHVDNQPEREKEAGWVDCFERQLAIKLVKRFGEPVDVWRDKKLSRVQLFDRAIERAARGSAVMVALLTSRYLKSDYCRQEMAWFCQTLEHENADVVDGDYRRLFPVLLYNIPHGEWPKPCEGMLAFPFHDGGENEYGEPLHPDSGAFQKQLRILAEDIYRVLKRLETARGQCRQAKPGQDRASPADPGAAGPVAAGDASALAANPPSRAPQEAAADFGAIQELFARFVGPMAGLLVETQVKRHALGPGDSPALARLLAPHIQDESESLQFLRLCGAEENAPPAAGPAARFAPEALERLERELSYYMGPVARALVAEAAKRAATLPALYHLAARHIPLPEERQRFLDTLLKRD
jgi:hypothetical protein